MDMEPLPAANALGKKRAYSLPLYETTASPRPHRPPLPPPFPEFLGPSVVPMEQLHPSDIFPNYDGMIETAEMFIDRLDDDLDVLYKSPQGFVRRFELMMAGHDRLRCPMPDQEKCDRLLLGLRPFRPIHTERWMQQIADDTITYEQMLQEVKDLYPNPPPRPFAPQSHRVHVEPPAESPASAALREYYNPPGGPFSVPGLEDIPELAQPPLVSSRGPVASLRTPVASPHASVASRPTPKALPRTPVAFLPTPVASVPVVRSRERSPSLGPRQKRRRTEKAEVDIIMEE